MKSKVIVLAGGGSGGHLTPLLAVGTALKNNSPNVEVVHIGQKGDALQDVVEHTSIDTNFAISAGKFRRYHGESFLQHIMDFKTIALNIRDFFKFIRGVYQAWVLLGKIKPDAVFLKGGFVCVPVGIASRWRRIPYITHDSDAVPGLANRITAKHAIYNTTAMQPDIYPYEASKTIQVGIPLQPEFKYVSTQDKKNAKLTQGYQSDDTVIFSVGGGLGARNLNMGVASASTSLLEDQNTYLIHLTGKALFDETRMMYAEKLGEEKFHRQVKLLDFTSELYALSAAADVVITRAGATNIAEFAAQAKPCIVVPAPHLTGGQQLHNAQLLEDTNAALVVQESEISKLADAAQSLIKDPAKAQKYGESLHKMAINNSSERIAQILVDISNKQKVDVDEVSA